MLSRIADSLYWMGRYMERVDGMLRLMQTSYILSFDNISVGFPTWEPSLDVFTQITTKKLEGIKNDNVTALAYLLTSPDNINSLRANITRARENARGVQDHITREVWEQVNAMYHIVQNNQLMQKLQGQDGLSLLESLSNATELYAGISDNSMPRGQGWNFICLGKFIERSILTLNFMNFYFKHINYDLTNEQDILYWRNLLLALSGYELYLKTFRTQNHNYNVAEQVLFSNNFPRSLYYSLERTRRYLGKITESNPVSGSSQLLKTFSRMDSSVKFAELKIIESEGLDNFFISLRKQHVTFTQLFHRTFFSYS